ncbi:tetraspanin-15-like [Rhodamnia argentea]|uniref:Tetraspanin-15-like n=1 Tax=Rhodamnia argentea TaxID=178133 RepID=A0A8B8P0J1_9MYRT|nr:tetraspanin-15-like [Rhodamnia argentea]
MQKKKKKPQLIRISCTKPNLSHEKIKLVSINKMAENTSNPATATTAAEAVTTIVAAVQEEMKPPQEASKEAPIVTADKTRPVRIIVGSMAILTFLLSLPVLASVIWLLYMKGYDCEGLLRLPKLQTGIGVALLFVFLISNLVVFLRAKVHALGLLVVMVPLILMLTMGLALVGDYKDESKAVIGSPTWLKNKVYNDNNWNYIKSCIYDSRTCDDLAARSLSLEQYDFSARKLSPVEFGCCRPPVICEMDYVNATYWRRNDHLGAGSDEDCDTWQNDEDVLCYDCMACKDGFLKVVRNKWWRLGLFLVLMSLLLIAAHLLLFIATVWERLGGM